MPSDDLSLAQEHGACALPDEMGDADTDQVLTKAIEGLAHLDLVCDDMACSIFCGVAVWHVHMREKAFEIIAEIGVANPVQIGLVDLLCQLFVDFCRHRLDPFDNRRCPHPRGDAQCRETRAFASPFQLIQKRADDNCARGSQWMTHGD